ncbi:hypothetical protein NC651_011083 [Populus alba x Populus x berolinensis]|nr:hypothetical protein NC651_011083 [Populus alba x Populus x berolinensis]
MQAIKLGMGTELLYKMLLVPLFTRRTRRFTDLNETFQVEEEYGGKVTFSKEDIQGRESSANSCSGFECLSKAKQAQDSQ